MHLFTVEEVYNTSAGLILTPAPDLSIGGIHIGTKIKLIFPDKTEAETVIKGIVFEFSHIAIPREWAGRLIPGTEVRTLD